jgi:hypothetical protein
VRKDKVQRRPAEIRPQVRSYRSVFVVLVIAGVVTGALYWHRWSAREAERQTNNTANLTECDAEFAVKVRTVLQGLETEGYRPWIRESWRSPLEQERAYLAGRSEIRLGFHNVTGRNGEHRAFAVDVVERMDGARAKPRYAVTLARLASASDLQTGISWGLMDWEQRAVERAVQTQSLPVNEYLKLGWDPCHLEPRNLTLKEALERAGATGGATAPPSTPPTAR